MCHWPLVVTEEHNVLSLTKDLAIACDVVSITIFCHFLHYCFVYCIFLFQENFNLLKLDFLSVSGHVEMLRFFSLFCKNWFCCLCALLSRKSVILLLKIK
jgi:hypothetical protein